MTLHWGKAGHGSLLKLSLPLSASLLDPPSQLHGAGVLCGWATGDAGQGTRQQVPLLAGPQVSLSPSTCMVVGVVVLTGVYMWGSQFATWECISHVT